MKAALLASLVLMGVVTATNALATANVNRPTYNTASGPTQQYAKPQTAPSGDAMTQPAKSKKHKH